MEQEIARQVIITAAVAAGALVQGSVGFGWALVTAPVLVWIDPIFVPGPMLLTAAVLTLLITLRERRSIDVSGVGWALAGRVPGAALGAVAVANLSQGALSVTFAVVVLLAVLVSLRAPAVRPGPRSLFAAGLASGVMGTTSAIGGPPMALLYQGAAGARLRGTLSGFFLGGSLISLASLALVGALSTPQLWAAASLLPGVLVGFLLSRYTRSLLDRRGTRAAVLLLAGASAVALLAREALR